ncbi:hypothetical protein E4U17_002467 [Claviceps sp. LM77 group G4]|nr:hypothetical protein E4U17_002467 [Claviceps sp. LM77 group G4]
MPIKTDIVLYRTRVFSYNAAIVKVVDTEKREHTQDWYHELNPNCCDILGSIPFITDTLSDGEKITLFDTTIILEYITDRYDNESRIKAHFGLKSNLQASSWVVL